MKITPEIIKEIECLLDMRKKNGDVIWEDGTELEFKISTPLNGQVYCHQEKGTTD